MRNRQNTCKLWKTILCRQYLKCQHQKLSIYNYSEKTEALAYAMRTAYYTAHENTHNTKYSSHLDLQRLNGLEILKSLRVGDKPIMNLVLLQKKLLTYLLI